MKIVYAVTAGEYSDYGIRAVFATQALAEAHVAQGGGDRVEEYDLLTTLPTQVIVYNRRCHVYPDGQLREQEWTFEEWSFAATKPLMHATTDPDRGGAWLVVWVQGTDPARVAKAYQDRVAAAKARQLGIVV